MLRSTAEWFYVFLVQLSVQQHFHTLQTRDENDDDDADNDFVTLLCRCSDHNPNLTNPHSATC